MNITSEDRTRAVEFMSKNGYYFASSEAQRLIAESLVASGEFARASSLFRTEQPGLDQQNRLRMLSRVRDAQTGDDIYFVFGMVKSWVALSQNALSSFGYEKPKDPYKKGEVVWTRAKILSDYGTELDIQVRLSSHGRMNKANSLVFEATVVGDPNHTLVLVQPKDIWR